MPMRYCLPALLTPRQMFLIVPTPSLPFTLFLQCYFPIQKQVICNSFQQAYNKPVQFEPHNSLHQNVAQQKKPKSTTLLKLAFSKGVVCSVTACFLKFSGLFLPLWPSVICVFGFGYHSRLMPQQKRIWSCLQRTQLTNINHLENTMSIMS